ncbi:hypothetical protein [Paenibacillus sp. OSY-SE]|uniref:hypothetical protein n=1 Tax=Paenibacillus sp. OSY-SE TaxID=1196323 RepID=UPI000314708A|nr:hypothetical protein [Paenibacillus sp. OSY-SE]
MKLLIGDKSNELLNVVYEFLSTSNKGEVIWLDGHDIINELVVDDEIASNQSQVKVNWWYRGIHITPERTTGVLNQLGCFDPSLFHEFAESDREFAQSEFNSYLLFALNEFRNVLNPAWGSALSGYCQSLPYQWAWVQRHAWQIRVPGACFSTYKHVPNDFRFGSNIIVSNNPFNVMNWKIGFPTSIATDEHYLWYERPRGKPFVITAIDNNKWIQPLGGSMNCSRALEDVNQLCHALMEHFHIRLAEILFFYDEYANQYTFGSIRPYIEAGHIPGDRTSEFLKLISAALDGSPL